MHRSLGIVVLVVVLGAAALGGGRHAVEASPASSTIFIPHILGNHCGDFLDDFSRATGWFEGRRDGLLAELRDGEYRLSVTQPGLVWLVGALDCARVNNQVAVTVRWAGAPGNFYGLLFGENGRAGNTYMLVVNSNARVWLLLRLDNGSLAMVMGPTGDDAIARTLGPADFEVGIIAGEVALNPVFGDALGPRNDGAVAVESARLAGMRDFLVVPYSHTVMLWRTEVVNQVRAFLRDGRFRREAANQ